MNVQSNAAELEQLIRDLNSPRNQADPSSIDAIQRRIQRLQRESSAWQIGLDLLRHNEAQMRFYGALTLTIKVNADWDIDNVAEDRNLVAQLIERLVTSYVELSAIPDETYVLLKLCATLVAVFQKSDSAWAFPIRHALACVLAGGYVSQDRVPEMDDLLLTQADISAHHLIAILRLASTLSEEAGVLNSTTKLHNVEVRMSNNAADVWKIIRLCVQGLTGSSNNAADKAQMGISINLGGGHEMSVARAVIDIVPFWTNYVQTKRLTSAGTTEVVTECFKACMAAFDLFFKQPELSPSVTQAFTVLEQNHHRLLIHVIPGYAASIIGSQTASSWIQQLLNGDFDVEPTGYAEYLEALLNQADVTSPSFLEDQTTVQSLSQMQQLLRCEGIAGIEDTVCQIALEILTSIAEGFNDWDEPTHFDDEIRSLIRQACHDCLLKLRMPTSELDSGTQTWDADDRARFQDFRYDVQDYLPNAFTVLGVELLDEIVRGVVDDGHDLDWAKFEANLFALVAFSDTMNSDPEKFDAYLSNVFGCDKWQRASNEPSELERVRKVMIKLVGENTGFLERHESSLVPILNFLFGSLHIVTSATSASRAIFTLCDAQRSMLVGALPEFTTSLETLSNLESDARSRVFGGVSAIIQALPSEAAKVAPLSQILTMVECERRALLSTTLEDAELKVRVTDLVWVLATIGKGLRAPSDAPVELDDNPQQDADFWTEGQGRPVQQSILSIYESLRQRIDGDSDGFFVEATCDFLKSAFTETHPSPFKFPSSVNLEILQRLVSLSNPQPDNVLGTASSYLASIKPSDNPNDFSILVTSVAQQCQDAIVSSRTNTTALNTEYAAAACEFFGRALPKWVHIWLKLPEFEHTAQIWIELGLILLQDSDTLPRRSSASLFTSLFEASGNSKVTMNQTNSAKMGALLDAYGPRILAAILCLLAGECARSELEALTEPLKRFIQKQPLQANKLIREAVKEENGVLSPRALQATNPEQRARFASQIIMLKGARKTNEIVREFWVACKGSSFGYVV